MEIIWDGAPGQIRPGIPNGMGCAVVATPRNASKQSGQDRVRTLSLAAGLASAPAVEPQVWGSTSSSPTGLPRRDRLAEGPA